MELVKLLTVHRYNVDIFSYSGPSGILGSDGKQNRLKRVLEGVRIVALSISSHEQTQLNQGCCFSYIVGSLYF